MWARRVTRVLPECNSGFRCTQTLRVETRPPARTVLVRSPMSCARRNRATSNRGALRFGREPKRACGNDGCGLAGLVWIRRPSCFCPSATRGSDWAALLPEHRVVLGRLRSNLAVLRGRWVGPGRVDSRLRGNDGCGLAGPLLFRCVPRGFARVQLGVPFGARRRSATRVPIENSCRLGNNRCLMSNPQPLMDALFSSTRQRVLAILLLRPTASYHLRALARLAGSHAGTLARELDKLTDAGLLRRSELGNQVRYQADPGHPLFDELASIFRKTHGAAALLRDALAPLSNQIRLACIFGSTARGTDTDASDVDLLVLGDVGFADLVQALHPVQQELQREINPVLYSVDEFRDRSNRREPFLREILEKSVVWLIGDDDDLAELAGHPATADAHGR